MLSTQNRIVFCVHADTWWQTLEVATARVYNWDVVQKRKENAEARHEGEDDHTRKATDD
jgi:hypothetical protein